MESPGDASLQRAIDAHNQKKELAGKHSESKMTEQLHRSGIRMRINSPDHIRQLAALSQGKEAVVWSPDSDDSFVVTPIKQSVKEEVRNSVMSQKLHVLRILTYRSLAAQIILDTRVLGLHFEIS